MTQRAVITGVSSFVGAHLAASFAAAGFETVAVHRKALSDYDDVRRARVEHAGKYARLARHDITEQNAIVGFIEKETPDIWVHHVGDTTNYTSPGYDWIGALEITTRPLHYLYQAFHHTNTAVIVTGTDQEYGAAGHLNREDDVCHPSTPYGLSKLAETLAARQLSHVLDVPTRIARVYIPFGQLDSPKKLLPQIVRSLQAGTPIALSAGEQRRDFMGVKDVCRAYLKIAGDMDRTLFDLFNISSGDPLRLRSLIETICDTMKADPSLLRFGEIPMRPGEPALSCGDSAKARETLRWEPRPIAQAIAEDLLPSS